MSWFEDRVKLFTVGHEEVKPGEKWTCLGCYSILPHNIAGGMQERDSGLLGEGGHVFLSEEGCCAEGSAHSCFLLSRAG